MPDVIRELGHQSNNYGGKMTDAQYLIRLFLRHLCLQVLTLAALEAVINSHGMVNGLT